MRKPPSNRIDPDLSKASVGYAVAALLAAVSSYLSTKDPIEAEWMADAVIAAATGLREIARKAQQ